MVSYNTSQISLSWYLQYVAFRCIYNRYFKYHFVFAVLKFSAFLTVDTCFAGYGIVELLAPKISLTKDKYRNFQNVIH